MDRTKLKKLPEDPAACADYLLQTIVEIGRAMPKGGGNGILKHKGSDHVALGEIRKIIYEKTGIEFEQWT